MGITEYLVAPKGANKDRKRRGRGPGSGHGKTSCRGNKGQRARGMSKRTKGFEGGQMPLIRRLPKRGFINKFSIEDQVVNIEALNHFKEGDKVTAASLKEKNIIKDADSPVKILGEGKLKKNLEVHADAFSLSAKKAIEEAGGKAVMLREPKPKHIVIKKPGKTLRPQTSKEQKPDKEKKQAKTQETKPPQPKDQGQRQLNQQQPKQEQKAKPEEKKQ